MRERADVDSGSSCCARCEDRAVSYSGLKVPSTLSTLQKPSKSAASAQVLPPVPHDPAPPHFCTASSRARSAAETGGDLARSAALNLHTPFSHYGRIELQCNCHSLCATGQRS